MTMPKPKKYAPIVTRRSYAVPMPLRDFARLIDRENDNREPGNDLGTELDKLPGVGGTEYNGHYGANIYYTVDADKDTPELQARIVELIHKYAAPHKRKQES